MIRTRNLGIVGLWALGFAILAFYSPTHPSATAASFITMSGDVATFLNELPLPDCNTNKFVKPSAADMATWRKAMDALLDQQYQTAATLADPLGYDLIEYTDTARDKVYYIFRERNNARGLGTYVYNPGACRLLSLQAPHAGGDANTKPESIAMFLQLNAVALLIPGTHRCSNPEVSTCDGTSDVCNSCLGLGKGDYPYRVSDVGHYTQNFFQPAHEEIATRIPGIVSVSIHGFPGGAADVVISNGTRGDLARSLATRLTDQYNQVFTQLGSPLRAGSCNAAGGPPDPCGGTNVQGRFVNGSANICNQNVATVSGAERFLHVEQVRALRQIPAAGAPGWQMTIDAFAATFPCAPIGHLTQEESGATSEADDEFGKSLAAGDFNGDGISDLAIGVPGEDFGGASNAGMVVVHYGASARGPQRWGQSQAGATNETGDLFGSALAVGDFNGDGKADLAIGVPGKSFGAAHNAGMVIVYYGSSNGLQSSGAQRLSQSQAGATNETGDLFGSALAAGDFNGDGKDDLAIGVPGEDFGGANNAGMVVVYYGSSSGLQSSGAQRWGQSQAGATNESGDQFGASLAAGDFNGDGKADLAIGVPGEDFGGANDAGMVVVYYGSSSGLQSSGAQRWGQSQAGATDETGDQFGASLAAGDFNGDGKADLAIGVPGEDFGGANNAGMVVVYYGSSSGLRSSGAQRWGQTQAGATNESNDQFGASLAAGDFNGDGKADLAIGVPGEDFGGADNTGMVVVYYGSSSGLTATGAKRLGQKRLGGIEESGDQFGLSLVAGDFNGDRKRDLAIGTPFEDMGGRSNAGAVYIYKGSSAGFIP